MHTFPEKIAASPSQHFQRNLTINQLKTWDQCKRKYYYQFIRQLKWPTDQSNFQLGQSVHKLMEFQAKNLPIEPLLAHADPKIQRTWDVLMRCVYSSLPVLVNEWGFMLPLTLQVAPEINVNIWLEGRVDRIAIDESDDALKIRVLDWKTGTGIPKNPEQDWQTQIYLMAAYRIVPSILAVNRKNPSTLRPEDFSFIYIGAKETQSKVEEVEINYSQEAFEKTGRRLESTLTDILQESQFGLPSRCPDPYCPYQPICGIEDYGPNPPDMPKPDGIVSPEIN